MAHRSQSSDDINIGSVFSAIARSKMRLLIGTALVGLVTFLGLSLATPRFISEAQLIIGGKGAGDPFREPTTKGQGAPDSSATKIDREAVASQVRVLLSRDLAGKLATDLRLNTRYEFNSALAADGMLGSLMQLLGFGGARPGESEDDRVMAVYFKALQVYQIKDSRVIAVEFSSADRELAAEAANRLIELYIEWLKSQTVKQTQGASEWLKVEIGKLREEVRTAEADVDRLRAQSGLYTSGPTKGTLSEQQLSELNTELSRAKAARSEAEARARGVRDMLKTGTADASPDVQKSPLIQRLVESRVRVERQIAELSATLLPGHPRMQQLYADLAGLKRQITAEVAKVAESLDREARITGLREAAIKQSLDDATRQVAKSAPDDLKLRELERVAKSKRETLESYLARYSDASSRRDVAAVPPDAEIISRARPASVAAWPKKGPITLLAMAASLLLGLAWIVTRELLVGPTALAAAPAGTPPSGPHSPRGGHLSTVGAAMAAGKGRGAIAPARSGGTAALAEAVPASATSAVTAAVTPPHPNPPRAVPPTSPVASFSPAAPATSSIADAAARIAARKPATSGCRTLVTGARDGIDPGEEALDLAQALAGGSRSVVLLDWTAEPGGALAELADPDVPGLSELVTGEASFEEALRPLDGSGVHIVAAGRRPSSLAGPLDADSLAMVLDALDETYDHIVVAGPRNDVGHLFEAIQGRFDAAAVAMDSRGSVEFADPPGTFLGFDAADLDVVRLVRAGGAHVSIAPQRMSQALGRTIPGEARI